MRRAHIISATETSTGLFPRPGVAPARLMPNSYAIELIKLEWPCRDRGGIPALGCDLFRERREKPAELTVCFELPLNPFSSKKQTALGEELKERETAYTTIGFPNQSSFLV